MTMAALRESVGREVGLTEWFVLKQERIDKFADATEDWQWIHLDRPRAQRESPYGATVAHGFLTLSMLSHLSRDVLPLEGVRLRVNYGLNRVRFPAPVREGWRIRARFVLQAVKEFPEGVDVTLAVTIEMDGAEKPCCVAEWIVRYYAG